MAVYRSKLTSQGRTSIPVEVRRKLGLGPGSIVEWREVGGEFVVRRAGQVTSQEIYEALFPEGPPRAPTLAALKQGIAGAVRSRHHRR